MLYWSEILGASVYRNDKNIRNVENLMLHPEEKIIAGFLLERRNRDISTGTFLTAKLRQ